MKTTNQAGFTLYELMITVLIIGVVLSFGLPNMTEFRQNSRITAAASDLHSTFYLARSEASRAKTNITICASVAPMAANPACGGEFENGWIVFEDDDGDIVIDGDELVLKRFPATPEGVTIDSKLAFDYFSFAATGQGRGTVNNLSFVGSASAVSTMVFCDERGNQTAAGGRSAARVLVVTPLGRATILHEASQITFHGGC